MRRASRSGSMRQFPSSSCCQRLSLAVAASESSLENCRIPALRRRFPATTTNAASSMSRQHSNGEILRPTARLRILATRPKSSGSLAGFATPPNRFSFSPFGRTWDKMTLTSIVVAMLGSLESCSNSWYALTHPWRESPTVMTTELALTITDRVLSRRCSGSRSPGCPEVVTISLLQTLGILETFSFSKTAPVPQPVIAKDINIARDCQESITVLEQL